MIVADHSSEKFDADNVEIMLEYREKERFRKENFSLAVVGRLDRRSCIQKLATSGQPSTKWASRPIPMTFIRAAESEVLTDPELTKLSSSAIMLSRLVIRGINLAAVIRFLAQYSKTFDASYKTSF